MYGLFMLVCLHSGVFHNERKDEIILHTPSSGKPIPRASLGGLLGGAVGAFHEVHLYHLYCSNPQKKVL